MARKTIAELAADKAALETYLDAVNHEIAARAGEVDPPEDDDETDPATQVETATDKAPAQTQKATE